MIRQSGNRFVLIFTMILAVFFMFNGCEEELAKGAINLKELKDLKDGVYVQFDTDKGTIVAELYYALAPMTVSSFVGLAEGTIENSFRPGEPYFDGLTFHRVEPNFVIQGGDPEGSGRGGPGYQFPNEIVDGLKHDSAGILSMANAGPDTNGSQFFITHNATPHLDGGYSVFGKVVIGQDVVDAIRVGDKMNTLTIHRIGPDAQKFQPSTESFKQLINESQAEKIAAISAMIEDEYPGLERNEDGIFYQILREGSGAQPVAGDTIQTNYELKLLGQDAIIDSSYERGEALSFDVGRGQVIRGWDITLLDMKVGEERLIVIPPELGYGGRQTGPIPANSFLVFRVELVAIAGK
jgi:peptidyl-prolyl cis-trans isomerase A (cyclophilin A)